jgi:hypothetical protein
MSAVVQVENALHSEPDLAGLRELVLAIMAEHRFTTDEMLNVLRQVRAINRAQGNARAEDLTLEVMDLVVGWCSPHVKIPYVA